MSPLALIPIGIYAIVATVGAEVGLETAKNVADEPEQKVTLTETFDFAPKARPNTAALATTSGLADPVVKAAIAEALRMQVEDKKQQLAKKSGTDATEQSAKDDPGQYFPQTENEDDGGYSATLGLKDESHNNWMK
jgi:hypothetical protein